MKKVLFYLFFLFFLSIFYRFSALKIPSFFWVDEFATVAQAKLVQKHGFDIFFQNIEHFEHHNITFYYFVSLTFKFFGESVQSARLPSIFLGALVPLLVYLLTKKFSKNNFTALSAGLLTALSYWQIAWSLQARSYMLQQVLVLLTIIFYFRFIKDKNYLNLFYLFILFILGILTHTTYLLVLISLMISFVIFNFKDFKKILKNPLLYIGMALIILIGLKTNTIFNLGSNLSNLVQNGLVNNVWYYHAFLWREYGLISFLGILGLIFIWQRDKEKASVLWLTLFLFLGFVCFLFAPYVSRYLLAIFPILLIGVSISLEKIEELISKKYKFIGFLLALGIVINGNKFVVKPQAYYSVNHDMREIAIINYDEVYKIVLDAISIYPGEVAVVDPWVSRSSWYLKTNCENCYYFRWIDEDGLVNGMGKKTDYLVNDVGEKYMPKSGNPPIRFIGELSDLKLAMSKYPKGFIFIDDVTLPADVIQYAKENFKVELYTESYPPELLENPYSIWPATLYSWGFE